MLGCIEHTIVVIEIFEEAKENKKDLLFLWFHLINVQGLIPHEQVDNALKKTPRAHRGLF